MTAKGRYDALTAERSDFLDTGVEAARLTLPYLLRQDEYEQGMKHLKTPWQSTGAKNVVTLSAKLMLALLPPQTSFFKLQIDDTKLTEQFDPQVKSELDLSFSKIERTMMESIAASDDRVVVHQALKHLVVSGNALIFMGKEGLKLYPLNRYTVDRDGNGNVIEIVTKERINKKLLEKIMPPPEPNQPGDTNNKTTEQVDIYTHVKREKNRFIWHQEVEDTLVPGSQGRSPIDSTPWIVLRFNVCDGEKFGRGRVEEFMGDLKSLEGLTQAMVEGSAAAAKVVFTVSPSSTTKPQTLAKAGNGAIVQGRPDDIGVVQVGKTADFATALQMIGQLEKRLADAFLVLNVRDSERTTAEEVRSTQFELESQLGGLFSVLTTEFLVPYLNRKLSQAQKSGEIPKLPDVVKPTIVAGINALGRGSDRDALAQFVTIIGQTMGPDAIKEFINPSELIKRMAAAQGIDVLNLVKTDQQLQQERQQQQQQANQLEMTKQASSLAQVRQQGIKDDREAQQQQQQQGQPAQGPEAPPAEAVPGA